MTESGDILNSSRSDIFQVENAEFVRAKCFTISTALDCSRNYVRGDCPSIYISFFLASLITNRVSLEEECLPSFEVLNCLLNLVASCLDDENEIPFKVIASFSVMRFALPSIHLIVLHSLVRSVFWSMFSIKFLNFFSVYVHRCVSGCLYSGLAVGSVSFAEVVSSGHHFQYLGWYRFLVESVPSSM